MTLIISDGFPFPIRDMDDIPEDILRRYYFIDQDVSCKEEMKSWKLLIQSVSRELAISRIYLNIQTRKFPDTDLKTLQSLKEEAQRLREQAGDFLNKIWFREHPFPDKDATPQLLEEYIGAQSSASNSRSKDFLRRRLKIEMAMHEWKNWSSHLRHQMPRRLQELEDIGLNAVNVLDSGAGCYGNASIPILQPDLEFVARFRIYNPGPTTWPPGCYGKLTTEDTPSLFGGGGNLVTARISYAVEPGKDAILEVPMRTPLLPGPEHHNPSMFHHLGWRMVTPGGVFFGFSYYYQYALKDGWQSRASARGICNSSKPTKEEVDKLFAKRPSRHGGVVRRPRSLVTRENRTNVPKPRSSKSYRILSQVRRIIKYVSPITEKVLSYLKPSEIAALTYAIGVNLTDSYHRQCLSPIREFPRYTAILEKALKSGHRVTLAGTDMKLFMDRITRPNKFWSHYLRSPPILIWLAVVSECPPSSRNSEDWHYEWLTTLEAEDLEIQQCLAKPFSLLYTDKHLPSINQVAIRFFGWTRDSNIWNDVKEEIPDLSRPPRIHRDGEDLIFSWERTFSLIQGPDNNFVNVHGNPLMLYTTNVEGRFSRFGEYFWHIAQDHLFSNVAGLSTVTSGKREYDGDDSEDTEHCAKKEKIEL